MKIPPWLPDLLDHIEDNITGDITLEKLASNTGYSVRHLQRQFKALTKENIGDYVRGRRLTLAMTDIMSSRKSILDIALEYGFQSQEAFTRAFQVRFGFPPRRFRLQNINNPITLRTKITASYLEFIHSGALDLNPALAIIGPMLFVGVGTRVDGNAFQSSIWRQILLDAFEQLTQRRFDREPDSPASFLISYHENRISKDNNSCIHMLAAKRFEQRPTVPECCECFAAPGGFYAVFNFKGEVNQLFERDNYILGTWLPHSGYWLGNAPALVEMKMDIETNLLAAKMFIPLRKRSARFRDPWWRTDQVLARFSSHSSTMS